MQCLSVQGDKEMKHLFIINPAAGKYDQTGEFVSRIRAEFEGSGREYEIAVSKEPGDCTRIARTAAQTGQTLRIYACGGDGTLNEVISGAYCYENAAVTHFPGGSGNDFIKIFSDPAAFKNLSALTDGEEARLDLIRCGDSVSANICSIGIDARIGTEIAKYKRLPLVTGNGAYLISTGINVVRGVHDHYIVEVDGERIDTRLSLICIANGRWYGGSFNPTPDAEPDDGILDVLLVKAVSRLTVAKIIGKYKAGQYRDFPDVIRHLRCRRIRVQSDRDSVINLDGEARFSADAEFTVLPKALRFFYPRGLTYHSAVREPAPAI